MKKRVRLKRALQRVDLFLLENHETLKPSHLGIKPETPSWPERTKMPRERILEGN